MVRSHHTWYLLLLLLRDIGEGVGGGTQASLAPQASTYPHHSTTPPTPHRHLLIVVVVVVVVVVIIIIINTTYDEISPS